MAKQRLKPSGLMPFCERRRLKLSGCLGCTYCSGREDNPENNAMIVRCLGKLSKKAHIAKDGTQKKVSDFLPLLDLTFVAWVDRLSSSLSLVVLEENVGVPAIGQRRSGEFQHGCSLRCGAVRRQDEVDWRCAECTRANAQRAARLVSLDGDIIAFFRC